MQERFGGAGGGDANQLTQIRLKEKALALHQKIGELIQSNGAIGL